jgi:hypothetical protein
MDLQVQKFYNGRQLAAQRQKNKIVGRQGGDIPVIFGLGGV